MSILFDSACTVKPQSFGQGVFARPRKFEPTPEERAWWASERARMEDAHYDELAYEAAAIDRYTRGHVL
jgi:hypothetical protein